MPQIIEDFGSTLRGSRWISPFHISIASTGATTIDGRVYLMLFEVLKKVTVDAITFTTNVGVPTAVTVGIYGKVVTEESPVAAPLVVQGTGVPAGANSPQLITFTPTILNEGRYYLAIEFQGATINGFNRNGNIEQVVGWSAYYDRGGGYGALTDPCPAVTTTGSNIPACYLRSVSTSL